MNNFKDFGIETNKKGYKGDKIKTDRLLNREIEVHECWIVDSTKDIGKERLDMQIKIDNTWYMVFTSGKSLIEAIKNNPQIKYPFKTTIVKEDDWLRFT